MLKLKKILIITAVMLVSNQALASGIAVVDSQYIFENSKLAQKANDEIKELTKEAQKNLQVEEEALTKRQEELISKKGVLSDDVYTKKAEELRTDIIEFRKEVKQINQELSIKNKDGMQDIALKIANIVSDYAKEKDFDVVVSKALLMYSKDAVNITEEVLKRLDSSN